MTDHYAALAAVLRTAFPDRDEPADVGPHTRLFADLGLASIDVIVLAEQVEKHYGRKLPFPQFLAVLRAKNAQDIELGELVAFLNQHVGPGA